VRYSGERDDDFESHNERHYSINGSAVDETPDRQTVDLDERERDLALQIDYIRPIGIFGRLETGYKGTLETLDNDLYSESFDYGVGEFRPDANLNNTFTYDEQIHAVYAQVAREFGPFSVQAGLRAEQAITTFNLTTTGESFDNDYFSLFPSAFVTYKPSEWQQFKATYSRRINRPGTWALNPFDDYDDPLFRRVGNPYLQPEYTNSFEIGYNQFTKETSLSISPYYRYTSDAFQRVERLDSNGASVLTWDNYASNESYGLEVIGSLRLGEWLNAYANFNAYRYQTDGSNLTEDLSSSDVSWSARGNATVTLPFDLSFQLSYFYRAPFDISGGQISSHSSANLAISQRFLDRRATVSLRISDLFDESGFSVWRETEQYYQESNRRWQSRQLNLSFSYNFGKQERKPQRRRSDNGGSAPMDPEGME
jgi:outer membrane receptor protein involved in Fe transport